MIKKRFLWVLLFAALVMSGSALYAQAPAGPEKVMVYKGEALQVQLTGQIWMEMVQNQYNMVSDTYPLWVNIQKAPTGVPIFSFAGTPYASLGTKQFFADVVPEASKRGSLIFDVRYAQLGLTLTGPGVLGGWSFARFEADFFGGFGTTAGNVSRQGLLRMRNAFAGLGWGGLAKGMWEVKVTFGQYTTIIMPYLAMPTTLSPLPYFERGVLFDWDQGILLSLTFGTPKANVMVDVDVTRVKGGNDVSSTAAPASLYSGEGFTNNDERGTGEASLHPGFHGRLVFNLNPDPIFGMMVGVQGHYMNQHQQILGVGGNLATNLLIVWPAGLVRAMDVPSKSIGAQARISVWIFNLVAGGWMGENMANFVAMFGSGVRENMAGTKMLADKGRGGYASLNIQLLKLGIPFVLAFNVGQEIKNDNKRLSYTAAPVLSNSEVSGTLIWFLNPYVSCGYEVGQMVTKNKGIAGTAANISHRLLMRFVF